jgi:hypothetical protein
VSPLRRTRRKGYPINHSKFLYIAALAIAPSLCFGQQLAFNEPSPLFPNNTPSTTVPHLSTAATAAASVPTWQSKFDRWVDVDTLSYGNRYRSTFDADGAHSFDQGQQRILAGGKFKFDAAGRYGIGFHMSSGRYFNWAYADFIGGGQSDFLAKTAAKMSPYQLYIMNVEPLPAGFLNSGGGQLYLRQLFLSAQPIRGITAEFGGLAINHGVNSEATSYDDDGYMSGERITIDRPKQIWLSEVSYTRGYLGDLYTPNFFARADRLSTSNYWQILARKDLGKRVSVSADYTATTPEGQPTLVKTTREGLFADVHRSHVFDSARFEAYQRINEGNFAVGVPYTGGKGFALTVTRSFKKRFSVDTGLADIDINYVGLTGSIPQADILGLAVNGDQYGLGKRYFVRPTIPLTSYMSLTGYFNHIFDTTDPAVGGSAVEVWNAQSLTAGVVFDAKKLLFHKNPVE